MKEEVLFCNSSRSLVGILTSPAAPTGDPQVPAVILVNAGLVHRVGPNRIYVTIARALAELGFSVLRIDLSGIGDSLPRTGAGPAPGTLATGLLANAEHVPIRPGAFADLGDAMEALAQKCGAQRFLLMGHCSGAILSLLAAAQEPRVLAAVLINPEGGAEAWEEYDRQRKESTYYANFYGRAALSDPGRVRRFLTGKADYRTIANNLFRFVLKNRFAILAFRAQTLLGKQTPAGAGANSGPFDREQVRLLLTAAAEHARLLFIHIEGSTGYEHLRTLVGKEIDQLRQNGAIEVKIIPRADHIFTLLASQRELVEAIQEWAGSTLLSPQPV